MSVVKIGRVRPIFKGDWISVQPYETMSIVRYQEETYQAIQDVPAGAVPSTPGSIYWFSLTLRGLQGIQGIQGEPADPSELIAINNRISIGEQVLHVQDQKASGNAGGTFTQDAQRIRDLNTIVINTIPGASLVNNLITLPEGKYYIEASAPAFRVARNQAFLMNPGLTIIYLQGTVAYSSPPTTVDNTAQARSEIKGVLTCSEITSIYLSHKCQTTYAAAGFGLQGGGFITSTVLEVYSDVFIRRIS